MKNLKKCFVPFCLALMLIFGSGACSIADQKARSGSAESQSSAQTVTILTHDSFALDPADIAEFERQSGYQLKTISASDGTVINHLRLKKDAPVVDGVYGIDNFAAAQALRENLVAQVNLSDFPASTVKVQENRLVPIDQADVCLNVDLQWFAEKNLAAPASLTDLLQPEYKNLTVIPDPVSSTPGFAFFAGTIAKLGAPAWKDYWEKLFQNGVKIASGWSEAYYKDFSGAQGKGAYPIVLSYTSSPAAEKGATGAVTQTCVQQIEYAAVVQNAANPQGAQAFIEFLLSEKVQSSLPELMYVYPVRQQIPLPADWAKYAQRATEPIQVDSAQVAQSRQQWLDDFTQLQAKFSR